MQNLLNINPWLVWIISHIHNILRACQIKLRKLESESDGFEEMIANLKFPDKANPECHLKSNNVSQG